MLEKSAFSERLDELMFERKLNSPTLAKEIGVDRSTISRYLKDNKLPTLENLISLADYFQCSINFLLGLENESYSKRFKKCPPFHQQLVFLLNHFGINKYQLQQKTQIPEAAIYNWQSGQYSPNVESIIKIANCLNCSVDFVLGREY